MPGTLFIHNPKSVLKVSWASPKVGVRRNGYVSYMTTVENLTSHCKLLGEASGQKSQRESRKCCGQFSLVFLVSFEIWGEQKRDFFFFAWKYRMELRISSKEQRDPSTARQKE